jgi:hypothetical protein
MQQVGRKREALLDRKPGACPRRARDTQLLGDRTTRRVSLGTPKIRSDGIVLTLRPMPVTARVLPSWGHGVSDNALMYSGGGLNIGGYDDSVLS